MRLGKPDPIQRLRCGDRDGERPRVGVPDVLGRADDQPPGDEPRVLAGRDHRSQPVQGSIGIVAAEALDERRDRVVVAVAGSVVGEDPLLGGRLDILETRADPAFGIADVLALGKRRRTLEDVEGRTRVPAREGDQVLECVIGKRYAAVGPESARQTALLVGERPPDDARDFLVGQRLEPPDAHSRQQRRVHLEVGVLGRRAGQCDRAVLDVGEESVLLGLVEAMNLVDEQDRPLAVQSKRSSAWAIAARTSATPDETADSAVISAPIASASKRASVVLPVPGGPHRISEARCPRAIDLRSGLVRRRGAPDRRSHRASAGASWPPEVERRAAAGRVVRASCREQVGWASRPV